MMLRWVLMSWRRAAATALMQPKITAIDRKWIGLNPWNVSMVWMKNVETEVASISTTQILPSRRCRRVPLRRNRTAAPMAAAGRTVRRWIFMASGASTRGARNMAAVSGAGRRSVC